MKSEIKIHILLKLPVFIYETVSIRVNKTERKKQRNKTVAWQPTDRAHRRL